MSVVIIGGNERMETRYADICKAYGYDKAKVFVMLSATQEAKRNSVPVARVHSSSVVALSQLLAERSASL
jgi:hypothetical protein